MFDLLVVHLGPIGYVLVLAAISGVAGLVGALLGIGGGLFMIPVLILLFGVDPHLAVAASLVSVIATSSGSASTYVDERLADIRVGMFLETATVVGALAGAIVSVTVLASRGDLLIFAFVPVVLLAAALMFRGRRVDVRREAPPNRLASRLRLGGEYFDEAERRWIPYRASGTSIGLAFAGFAGVVAGLLGLGGGLFYVPAMNSFMNIPVRVAGATSNFMIGVTATAGALVYYFVGDVAVALTAPVALGILAGSLVGARLHRVASTELLKLLFVGILGVAAIVMLLRGFGVLG